MVDGFDGIEEHWSGGLRIALLIVLDHRSVYIGIRHADLAIGSSSCCGIGKAKQPNVCIDAI